MTVNSTNFTSISINSDNYGKSVSDTDVLLLETGDELLLENGTDSILLEGLETKSTNFTSSSINSTNYSG